MKEIGISLRIFGLLLALAALSEDCAKRLHHQRYEEEESETDHGEDFEE